MVYLLIFMFGLCVGSFLNVLIDREEKGEDWVWGRSHCDFCQNQLAWYDNIPLLSFLILRGKCRFCGHKISWQYPLVEILTGIQFVWIYFLIQSNLTFFSRFEGFYSFLTLLIWLTLGACFLAIFMADFKYQIIPDIPMLVAGLASLLKILIDYRYTGMIDFSVFPSALGAGLFFLSLVLLTKRKGMGWGDVELAVLMGLILGFPKILIALFFSFLTGALLGVILIIEGRKKLKSKIAFGPFLIAGLIFSLIYGEKIWFYFN